MAAEVFDFVVVGILVVASAVAVIVRFLPIPYATAMAAVGLALGAVVGPLGLREHVTATPDLILFILLPGLLFEAAFRIRWAHLRPNLAAVVALATIGVVLTMVLVALLGAATLGLSLPLAVLLGSMVAATDPVSVVAVFRRLHVSPRLTNLIEAESLANDGTGVVLFTIALGAATGAGTIGLGSAIGQFVVLTGGGLAVGLGLGLILSWVTLRIDDYLVEISITAVAAYGGYLLGQSIHVSGILVVVGAGLVIGNYGRPRGMSPRTVHAVEVFWDYVGFGLNSAVFLLIGLDVPWADFHQWWWLVLAAAVVAILARAATVYSLLGPFHLLGRGISLRWQHLLVWGGLRGAVAIALALSLEGRGPEFDEVRALVYGVVLISILVQGVTIGPLTRRLLGGETAAAA